MQMVHPGHMVQWHAFGLHTNRTKTLVHFFPSAGSLTAPYPAQCRLTAYGDAVGVKTVTLDGGRVSQPDGICIDDVFPSLESEKSAAVGLIIEVSTMQPRLNISTSDCVIEFVTEGFSTRFHPAKTGEPAAAVNPESAEDGKYCPLGVAIKDKYTSTSIFMLNPSENEVQPALSVLRKGTNNAELSSLEGPGISPSSLREISIGDNYYSSAFEVQQPYGMQQYLPLVYEGTSDSRVVMYCVYRDASTGCPVSVSPLSVMLFSV